MGSKMTAAHADNALGNNRNSTISSELQIGILTSNVGNNARITKYYLLQHLTVE
jgi:hypothetical protein